MCIMASLDLVRVSKKKVGEKPSLCIYTYILNGKSSAHNFHNVNRKNMSILKVGGAGLAVNLLIVHTILMSRDTVTQREE